MNDIIATLRKVQTQLSVLHGEVTDLISHFEAAKIVTADPIDPNGGPSGGAGDPPPPPGG